MQPQFSFLLHVHVFLFFLNCFQHSLKTNVSFSFTLPTFRCLLAHLYVMVLLITKLQITVFIRNKSNLTFDFSLYVSMFY